VFWIPAVIVFMMVGTLLGFLAPNPEAEYLRFVLVLVRLFLAFLIYNFVRMILDYARIAIVRRDSRSAFRALLAGARFVTGRPGRTLALFYLFVLTALPFLIGYGFMRIHWPRTTPAAVAGVFVLTQVLIYIRAAVRIASQAGQWKYSELFEAAEHAGGQGDQSLDQVQNGAYRETEQAKGEKEKPDDRVEEEGEKGQGPAEDQKDEP